MPVPVQIARGDVLLKKFSYFSFLKKAAAILLCAILLFNWFGYRLMVSFMEMRANQRLESQLNKNDYNDPDLVSIKIPLQYLPYYSNNNSSSFERIDGQIEIQGTLYKYVKRRIFNDSLEIMCIPNHEIHKLQNAQNAYFIFTNDIKQEKKSESHSTSGKAFSVDFYSGDRFVSLNELYFTGTKISSRYHSFLPSSYAITAEHPPQSC